MPVVVCVYDTLLMAVKSPLIPFSSCFVPVSGNAVDEHQADDAQHGGDAAEQHHEDADMADAGADLQHQQQDDYHTDAAAQQQQNGHEQQQLHTTESDALLNLGEGWLAGVGWSFGWIQQAQKLAGQHCCIPVAL